MSSHGLIARSFGVEFALVRTGDGVWVACSGHVGHSRPGLRLCAECCDRLIEILWNRFGYLVKRGDFVLGKMPQVTS